MKNPDFTEHRGATISWASNIVAPDTLFAHVVMPNGFKFKKTERLLCVRTSDLPARRRSFAASVIVAIDARLDGPGSWVDLDIAELRRF